MAKRYIDEPGSGVVEKLCSEATSLGISIICFPEIISGLCRLMRERRLKYPQYFLIKQALARDVENASVCNITPNVISECTVILEKTSTRAMDAIHVGCAMEWQAELFVSADIRQIAAAKKFGLKVKKI